MVQKLTQFGAIGQLLFIQLDLASWRSIVRANLVQDLVDDRLLLLRCQEEFLVLNVFVELLFFVNELLYATTIVSFDGLAE